VPIANITFKVLVQGIVSYPEVFYSQTSLSFETGTEIWEVNLAVHDPAVNGYVKIFCLSVQWDFQRLGSASPITTLTT